jgi:hypothetical protein
MGVRQEAQALMAYGCWKFQDCEWSMSGDPCLLYEMARHREGAEFALLLRDEAV